jgi:uncharacterized membrane protein
MWWNGFCHAWNNGAFGTWGWIGFGLNLLLWAALIGGAIYLIVSVARRAGASNPTLYAGEPLTGMRIAQERYARGEISREEYLNIVEDLK